MPGQGLGDPGNEERLIWDDWSRSWYPSEYSPGYVSDLCYWRAQVGVIGRQLWIVPDYGLHHLVLSIKKDSPLG